MLHAPIVSTLCGYAWPNILMMFSQSSAVLVETFFLAKLGTNALAGAALVAPVLMLVQNMSQGDGWRNLVSHRPSARGARADEADELVLQAVLLNGGLGLVFTALILLFGSRLYAWMGAGPGAHAAALQYSNVIAIGLVFMWVMNARSPASSEVPAT